MNKVGTKIILMVAITGLFSTVAPVVVSAEDTVMISNTVRSSSHTGGSDGQNGTAGADGADGKDGADGADGQTGRSSAGVSVTNIINGQDSRSVVEISTTGEATVAQEASVSTSTQSETVVTYGATTETADDVPRTLTHLETILASLKVIITTYAQYLF